MDALDRDDLDAPAGRTAHRSPFAVLPNSQGGLKAGAELEVQLSPYGAFPGLRGDERVIQRCDRVAFEAVVKNFRPEVLVDFEHHAETGGNTEAAAWVQRVRVDPAKGLLATFRFTDAGADAVSNRRLRFLSPVWELDPAGRPVRLISVGLTNKPNLPVRPVFNRAPVARGVNGERQTENGEPLTDNRSPGGAAAPRSPLTDNRSPFRLKGENPMNEDTTEPTPAAPDLRARLIEILGLGPDADDAAIIQAAENLRAVAAEAQEAALNAEAEAAAEENKEAIQNKEAFKRLYVANREAGRAFAATLRRVPAPTPVCNRAQARRPAPLAAEADADRAILNKWERMAPGPEKDAFLVLNKAAIQRACANPAD